MSPEPKMILENYFGYESFKPGQQEIITSILNNNNTLGVMPTGGGKSICFQIPAVCLSGIAVVFSPLISLMKDQIDSLQAVGIDAAFINSSLTRKEIGTRINQVKTGHYDLLYVAPERLQSRRFLNLLETVKVSLVVVDEAHCISQWGHDFRPSYLLISDFLEELPSNPVVAAFTATATEDVRRDIGAILDIEETFITTFDRENLTFKLVKGEDKRDFILEYVTKNSTEAGIIYAATRKEVDNLHTFLKNEGFKVGKYHAGLSKQLRKKTQDDFLYDEIKIVVATNAFGMGIDKSNVRYVIHHNMPQDIESYYQEAGRAGRDGEPAECVLLFSPGDIRLPKYFIDQSNLSTKRKALAHKKLQQMIDYCYTSRCLRAYILDYFGEDNVADSCDNCSNCDDDKELVDITVEAQKILSCIYRMDQRYGIAKVAKVLRGSKAKEILKLGFNKLSTYGIIKDYTIKEIKNLIKFLVAEKYIELTEGKYPVAKLTDKAYKVLQGEKEVLRKVRRETEQISQTNQLFEILRELRKEIAEEENVPPFIIFHDSTLRDMVDKLPVSSREMLKVKGVGAAKMERYGGRFLEKIKEVTNRKEEVQNKEIEDSDKSYIKSYKLYKSGKGLEEIANLRDLALSTIQSHILRAAKEGLKLDLASIVSDERRELISEKIEENDSNKLKPIKEALPEEISYFEIKAVLYDKLYAGTG